MLDVRLVQRMYRRVMVDACEAAVRGDRERRQRLFTLCDALEDAYPSAITADRQRCGEAGVTVPCTETGWAHA